jgi:hypothetical protein
VRPRGSRGRRGRRLDTSARKRTASTVGCRRDAHRLHSRPGSPSPSKCRFVWSCAHIGPSRMRNPREWRSNPPSARASRTGRRVRRGSICATEFRSVTRSISARSPASLPSALRPVREPDTSSRTRAVSRPARAGHAVAMGDPSGSSRCMTAGMAPHLSDPQATAPRTPGTQKAYSGVPPSPSLDLSRGVHSSRLRRNCWMSSPCAHAR